ncbi:MAG: hypothetical protein QM754_16225 [Tepidisphaeraceae bacterium]
MIIDLRQYNASVEYYRQNWRLLDDTLLRLCSDYPDHTSPASVNAKLWIVGRTYATGIERRVRTTGSQGSSMSQVAAHFLAHSSELEAIFGALRPVSEPLDPVKLRLIVALHGRLVTLLGQITNGKSARSFASKYMHFHNPVVPIYDSVAAAVLPRHVHWCKELSVFEMPAEADQTYGWYAMRLYRLYERVAEAKLPLSVKYLDNYLLWIADDARLEIAELTDAEAG